MRRGGGRGVLRLDFLSFSRDGQEFGDGLVLH